MAAGPAVGDLDAEGWYDKLLGHAVCVELMRDLGVECAADLMEADDEDFVRLAEPLPKVQRKKVSTCFPLFTLR